MWECQNCDEKENELSFNFCISCGAPKADLPEAAAAEEDVKTAFDNFINYRPKQTEESHLEEAEPHERRWHMPKSLSAIGHKVKSVLPIHNGDLNHVKVSPDVQHKLDDLVRAGVFDTKAEAAAYLIEKGIQAEARLFDAVQQKLSEIERLRAELRNLVKDSYE